MKIGIEEEFIVVDPETLFCTPGAFRLATHVVYKDFKKTYKCSVELPLSSRSIGYICKNLKKAFTVFEIKTDPYEDIDFLYDELVSYRKVVADIVEDNHLMVLPTGIHPLCSTHTAISDNCAALHIHVDYQKENFSKIFQMLPFLISISTNSPFINGKILAMSNRLEMSPHVGVPSKDSVRNVDMLHNKRFGTIEVRVLDSQITAGDSIGLASMIKQISESDGFNKILTRNEYIAQRKKAIREGFQSISLPKDEYELLAEYNKYIGVLLEQQNGSDWQIEIFKEHGLASVITSLWESFKQNKRTIKTSSKNIITDKIHPLDIWYILPYAPFFFVDKYMKCKRDIPGLIKFIASIIGV